MAGSRVATAQNYVGVNLSGAEFGESQLPGTYGPNYIYPSAAEIDYYVEKGMNLFRVPFRWERLQRSLSAPLDATESARLQSVVNYATAQGAHVINTDVWASMGQEGEAEARRNAFKGYTVDSELMKQADPKAIFLHCLPAHRGEEVTADVIDGPQSRVWDEAENRLHVQKALLATLMA